MLASKVVGNLVNRAEGPDVPQAASEPWLPRLLATELYRHFYCLCLSFLISKTGTVLTAARASLTPRSPETRHAELTAQDRASGPLASVSLQPACAE